MPSQGEKYSEFFHVFSELHIREVAKYKKARALHFFSPVGYLSIIIIPETKIF